MGESGVLWVPWGKEFPDSQTAGWDFVESFMDGVKLRGFPSKVSSLSVVPWKKSNLVFNRVRIEGTAKSFCPTLKFSPVQLLASLACDPTFRQLHMGSKWPWARPYGGLAHGQVMVQSKIGRVGKGARKKGLFVWDYNQELHQLTLRDSGHEQWL